MAEKLRAERASVEAAWQGVRQAVSAFAQDVPPG
jgi:hypothetical protein